MCTEFLRFFDLCCYFCICICGKVQRMHSEYILARFIEIVTRDS